MTKTPELVPPSPNFHAMTSGATQSITKKYLKVLPIYDFIKRESENFFNRLPQITNESVREIPVYDNSILGSSKRPRAALNHSYQHFPALKGMRMS
ncbi:hypothetical protein TNCV_2562551 [Trichonephila clavipes]|uniref:Uncharacterized protein n=1 Tax=Trichonephila clavipes TaxID=2585209 RepID=A0A8X6R112_TRICX|nr:hypothetical protein TNCV_2562551 [Trichonephila clavipes]